MSAITALMKNQFSVISRVQLKDNVFQTFLNVEKILIVKRKVKLDALI